MAKFTLMLSFLTLFYLTPSLAIYIPPQPPQQSAPSPSANDVDFLLNLLSFLDPTTMGLDVLTNSFKLYDAVPHCYDRHQDTFDSLRNRVLSQPTRCFAQPMDKLIDQITDTFYKTMKAYVKMTEFLDSYGNNNKDKDIFAMMQFVTEEKQLAMEILESLNFIVNSSYPMLASPNCVVDEAYDVYGQYQGQFNDALYCLQEKVTERPRNLGY